MLSRAELDALPLDNNLKSDVERGKVITMTHKYVPVLYWYWQLQKYLYLLARVVSF